MTIRVSILNLFFSIIDTRNKRKTFQKKSKDLTNLNWIKRIFSSEKMAQQAPKVAQSFGQKFVNNLKSKEFRDYLMRWVDNLINYYISLFNNILIYMFINRKFVSFALCMQHTFLGSNCKLGHSYRCISRYPQKSANYQWQNDTW